MVKNTLNAFSQEINFYTEKPSSPTVFIIECLNNYLKLITQINYSNNYKIRLCSGIASLLKFVPDF